MESTGEKNGITTRKYQSPIVISPLVENEMREESFWAVIINSDWSDIFSTMDAGMAGSTQRLYGGWRISSVGDTGEIVTGSVARIEKGGEGLVT